MSIAYGWFADPKSHHKGWFRLFRGARIIEIWFGHRYVTVSR